MVVKISEIQLKHRQQMSFFDSKIARIRESRYVNIHQDSQTTNVIIKHLIKKIIYSHLLSNSICQYDISILKTNTIIKRYNNLISLRDLTQTQNKPVMERQNISSGSPWEDIVGYSRAVRIGNIIEVAGTTAVDGDRIVGLGDPYQQTHFILQKIEMALEAAGASMKNVIRTRMFVRNISDWEEIGKAHGAFFSEIKPAVTMVEVRNLMGEDLLVEIEVSAIIEE